MKHINRSQEGHLKEITHILSLYRSLRLEQIYRLYPELPPDTIHTLLKRLERAGRITIFPDTDLILDTPDATPNQGTLLAFWVLLDFLPELTYHTVSDYPTVLTFYTASDGYDVIYASEETELLLNHALSHLEEDAPHRIVIIDTPNQIPHLHFPGILAFCTVTDDGNVQYYQKQGVT